MIAGVPGADSSAAAHSQVMLRPAVGAPGTVVKLTGHGFPAGRLVAVATRRRRLAARRADRRGRFAARLRIPGRRPGPLRLVSARGGLRVTSLFRLRRERAPAGVGEVASSTGRRVRWTPIFARAGAQIRLRGSGFRPGERLVVSLFGQVRRLRAGRRGAFAALLTVPALAGRHAGSVRTRGLSLRLIVGVEPTISWPPPSTAVIAGAGDIAASHSSAEETARLLDDVNPDVVYTTGDNAYPDGAAADYASWYEPTWGRHKAKTRPTPGNHDYVQPGAGPYFNYFGPLAGEQGKGYYAYVLGSWRLYALNSNISMEAGSPQETWLRADLAENPSACVLAYWHRPRFSAGHYGDSTKSEPIWDALYDGNAELVLNGPDHNYQRYAPVRPDGVADQAKGIREFVVRTGGNRHCPAGGPRRRPSGGRRRSDLRGVEADATSLRLRLAVHPGAGERALQTAAQRLATDGAGPMVRSSTRAPLGRQRAAPALRSCGEDKRMVRRRPLPKVQVLPRRPHTQQTCRWFGAARAIAKLIEPQVARVVVSNPHKTRAIAEVKVKTDEVDAEVLAQLLAADYLPAVWLPDNETHALRRQVARRAHIVRQRTRLKNQVQSILHRSLVPRCPAADLFGRKGRTCSSRSCPSTRRAPRGRGAELGDRFAEPRARLVAV